MYIKNSHIGLFPGPSKKAIIAFPAHLPSTFELLVIGITVNLLTTFNLKSTGLFEKNIERIKEMDVAKKF